MKHRFFYGIKPNINSYRPKDFSQKDYECSLLFQTKRGAPVVVARHKSLDIWKVQNGFSTVFFGTKAEALAYDVTEQLKAENQMEWVRQMNACKAQAEAIVKFELIYD